MKNVLTCILLASVMGCDDGGTTSAPSSVPSPDLAATVPTTPAADMATTTPSFPATAAVTVGPNNTLTYSPSRVDIAAGGTVTWTWAAGITMPHTVTSGDNPPAFPSSPVQMSGTFQATFANPGTYSYFCTVHGRIMSGTVVVH